MFSFDNFLKRAKKAIPNLNLDLVQACYNFAEDKHKEQKRANGDPYIMHPLSVANILLDVNADEEMIMAAILHDVIEDQDVSKKDIASKFGRNVAMLVEGVTKLAHFNTHGNDRQIDSLRKMFLAMAKDIRVVVIKLADRLHNMQTLEHLRPDKQKRISQETLFIYAPIASRLGLFHLKAPLEDLSFFYLHPDDYHAISEQVMKHEIYRERLIKDATSHINKLIRQHNINGQVKCRIKHFYSIYKKLKTKNTESIDDIYDIFAMRVVVSNIVDCYTVLGIIHEHFKPIAKRFKDYIAVPKPNGYKSLHTTVIGISKITKKTLPIEIQIRTREMDEEAEFGVATHWKYKEKGSQEKNKKAFDKPQEWIESLVEMEKDLKDNEEFARHLSSDSFSDRIYALTPMGDIKDLPKNATPIDFAFAVHTDIALRMQVAKANGLVVPLSYKINNGDIIEIVTNKNTQPSQNWISWCITNRAKNKIRHYLNKKDPASLMRDGKDLLNKQLLRFNLELLDQNLSILKNYAGKKRSKSEREEIILHIGNGSLSASAVIKNIAEKDFEDSFVSTSSKDSQDKIVFKKDDIEKTKGKSIIEIGGDRNLPIKIASCCSPKKGDSIVGFVTRGNYIAIHKKDCKVMKKLDPERLLDANYVGENITHQTTIDVNRNTIDRKGFLHDLTGIFLEEDINLLDVSFPHQGSFVGTIRFVLEFASFDNLDRAIEKIEEFPEVDSVHKLKK